GSEDLLPCPTRAVLARTGGDHRRVDDLINDLDEVVPAQFFGVFTADHGSGRKNPDLLHGVVSNSHATASFSASSLSSFQVIHREGPVGTARGSPSKPVPTCRPSKITTGSLSATIPCSSM